MALSLLYSRRNEYKEALSKVFQEAAASQDKDKQLWLFRQPERITISTELWTHRAGQKDIVYPMIGDEREEVVFRTQGYVVRAELPPITREEQLTKNPSTAKQSVVLTGLGCGEFDGSVRAIIALHSRFATHLPVDMLNEWKPITDSDMLCLEFANRYLTPNHLAMQYDQTEIPESVDPMRLLRSKAKGGCHTEDNQVQYYEKICDSKGCRYVPCSPMVVKPGLLVEVQVSFCTVPISKGRFIMLSKLRAVCVLSRQVQEDLNDQVFERLKVPPKLNVEVKKVKRKVGYGALEDEGESTSEAMKRMRLGDKLQATAMDY